MVISGREVGRPTHKTPHVNLSPFIHEPSPILPRSLMRPCWRELDGAQWGETLGGKRKHRPRGRLRLPQRGGAALLSCGPFSPHAPVSHHQLHQLLLLIDYFFIPHALYPHYNLQTVTKVKSSIYQQEKWSFTFYCPFDSNVIIKSFF